MTGRGKGGKELGKRLRKGELSIHLILSTRHRMAKNTLRNSMYFSLCILFLLVQNLIFFVCSFKILENVTKSRFARFLQTFSRILKLHTQKTKFYTSANKMPSSNYILLRKVSFTYKTQVTLGAGSLCSKNLLLYEAKISEKRILAEKLCLQTSQ